MPEDAQQPSSLSRREFVQGTVGAAAGAALVLGGLGATTACAPQDSDSAEATSAADSLDLDSLSPIEVAESQVLNISDTEQLDPKSCIRLVKEFDIAQGSLLFMDSDTFSVVISPAKMVKTFTQIGFVSIPSGSVNYVLPEAIGSKEGFVLYDARANSNIIVWSECNMHTNDWRLYVARVLSTSKIGKPVKVDEGDANFDPPMLAVSGKRAYWTFLPNENGDAADSDSYLKSIGSEGGVPKTEYTSHGRIATNPVSSAGIISFTPRVDSSAIYYQMTALGADSQVLAAEVLPKSMRPNDCIYIDGIFLFGIEKNYGFGEGLANFGTYFKSGDYYLRLNKVPTDIPARCGKYYFIKGDKSVVGVDVSQMKSGGAPKHFTIDTLASGAPYGDVIASSGTSKHLVLFTSLQDESGSSSGDGSGDGSVEVAAAGTTRVRVFVAI